jgi:DNA polymerase-3 subunit alpha
MDKNKQRMAFLTVDTLQCPREVVVFASTYKKYEGLLVEGATLMLTGKKDGEKMLLSKAKELN